MDPTTDNHPDNESRRQWFTSLGWWSALAAISAVTSVLTFRREQAVEQSGCPGSPCDKCYLSAGCQQPAAIEWKRQPERNA